MLEKFKLNDKVVVITGGAGLLGVQHAEAIAEIGGLPILFDINECEIKKKAKIISQKFKVQCIPFVGSVTDEKDVLKLKNFILKEFGHLDVLINNAALNPKVEPNGKTEFTRLENYNLKDWNKEISVGLSGAFLCSKILGPLIAQVESGVIINISSDLGVIGPDQRLYKKQGINECEQPVKPVSYSVIKHGIIGLTKYLATYWAHKGMRANALCPGGIKQDQDDEFILKINRLIPLGRMANIDEYKCAIQFLCTDASKYMNGSILVIDGGRSAI